MNPGAPDFYHRGARDAPHTIDPEAAPPADRIAISSAHCVARANRAGKQQREFRADSSCSRQDAGGSEHYRPEILTSKERNSREGFATRRLDKSRGQQGQRGRNHPKLNSRRRPRWRPISSNVSTAPMNIA